MFDGLAYMPSMKSRNQDFWECLFYKKKLLTTILD